MQRIRAERQAREKMAKFEVGGCTDRCRLGKLSKEQAARIELREWVRAEREARARARARGIDPTGSHSA